MQRQGSDVICAFDYTHVEPEEIDATEKCGDGLVRKVPLDYALKHFMGRDALWVFDGNDLPKEADKLRAKGEQVIGTTALGQRLEDDRDFAAMTAESLGFALPETEKFTDYGKALQFLQANTDTAYVYKPDKQDPTATYVPQDDDPGKANQELQEYLNSMMTTAKPSFIVQEVVHGIEINLELWVRDGQPIMAFGDLESKRKLVGDLGENVGCAGDYILPLPLDTPIVQRTVAQYLGWPPLAHYTGSIDANVMIAEDGQAYFLENCFRFGYNAYPTIFQALTPTAMEVVLRDWVSGSESLDHYFPHPVGGSLSLVVDRPKTGTPMIIPPEAEQGTYLYRCYRDEKALAIVDGWAEVACVVSAGNSIPEVGRQCLELAKAVAVPGKGYRIDLPNDDLPTLPEARYQRLQQMGLLPFHVEHQMQRHLSALMGSL